MARPHVLFKSRRVDLVDLVDFSLRPRNIRPMASAPDLVLLPRPTPLIGGLTVARVLPRRQRRAVGPFIFLDDMEPYKVEAIGHGDVPPHPHTGLATVTYLFSGQLVHRDSVGSVQTILPGDVNWMHAGNGVVHSERLPQAAVGTTLHGLQAWVGLPMAQEATAPWFAHHPRATLPGGEQDGMRFSLIAGSAWGCTSPVQVASPMVYAELHLEAGAWLDFTPQPGHEVALYLMRGQLAVGSPEQVHTGQQLLAYARGTPIKARAVYAVHAMLLGGAPLDGAPRLMYWNFVASSAARLEEAKAAWREQRFPKIPGESDFVPMP